MIMNVKIRGFLSSAWVALVVVFVEELRNVRTHCQHVIFLVSYILLFSSDNGKQVSSMHLTLNSVPIKNQQSLGNRKKKVHNTQFIYTIHDWWKSLDDPTPMKGMPKVCQEKDFEKMKHTGLNQSSADHLNQ
ncbi:unnamed protein product [Boreogadus saida]